MAGFGAGEATWPPSRPPPGKGRPHFLGQFFSINFSTKKPLVQISVDTCQGLKFL